jgi:hypothetical protein
MLQLLSLTKCFFIQISIIQDNISSQVDDKRRSSCVLTNEWTHPPYIAIFVKLFIRSVIRKVIMVTLNIIFNVLSYSNFCVKHTHVVSYYSELDMYQSIVWAWFSYSNLHFDICKVYGCFLVCIHVLQLLPIRFTPKLKIKQCCICKSSMKHLQSRTSFALVLHISLFKDYPKHHEHKEDPGVTPETCDAVGERAEVEW